MIGLMQINKNYGIIMKLEFSRGGKTILTPLPLLPNFRRKEPTMSENQNQLILLQDLGMMYTNTNYTRKRRYGLYKCGHCGIEFKTRLDRVKNKKTMSCGCIQLKKLKESITTHELSNTKIYRAWAQMKQRVLNKNDKASINYSQRGIKICDRWLKFENFMSDMYSTYKEGLTLDIINNDGNYEPSNCRWATRATQARNTRLIRKNNTSGYRGVHYNKNIKKFSAQIMVMNKTIHLGYFKTALEAAKAYNNYVIDNKLEHTINDI